MQDAAKGSSVFLDEQIKAVAMGDKSALAALYECAKTSVYAYALSVVKSRQDAEDVLQDVLLEIWRSAPSYVSMGKPMAWIITITRSICLMKLRKRSRTADEPLDLSILGEKVSNELSPEDRIVLKSCLEELSEREREIVILHAVSGLKHKEIAKLLGLPLSTVLSKYNRAIHRLRKTLQENTKGALT